MTPAVLINQHSLWMFVGKIYFSLPNLFLEGFMLSKED